ncbi:hypothetical protein AOQ84DRAFT_274633, partial [Glonium stellatum]
DRWETYRETLRTLYVVENKTLKKVSDTMKSSYNFEAPLWEFETKLRRWGFTKNLKKEEWPVIASHLSKRKREGK